MELEESLEDEIEHEPSVFLRTGEVVPLPGEVQEEDTFKILVASDIHLGYCDNDPERGTDSFTSFEEILTIAKENEVDFILLGGDLFHENRPKLACLRRATELFRKYCLGDKPVAFQYVSDPKRDFANQDDPEVNYYDANINVAIPVFSIHGNHDDPVGTTKTSAVDHLAAAKLLNHFGQWDNLNRITISPVLLVKGVTKLALYGLGHMKDERLHRLIQDRRVMFIGPEEEAGKEEWFNILVLHQNREKRGPKNYIPETFIPGYMQFVLWGHEHESKPEMDEVPGLKHTRILQPGSPVATSLCGGETKEKHCFILNVNRRKFKVDAIKLKTVRPFLMRDVMGKDVFQNMKKNASAKEKSRHLEKYLDNLINRLVEEAEDQLTGHPQQPVKPLLRIRVFHDNLEETFNPNRINQKFLDKVANEDIVVFKKMPGKREDGTFEIDADDMERLVLDQEEDDDIDSHVESIVENYFRLARAEGKTENLLEVLGERGLSEAVKTAVEKNDDKAIELVIESQVDKTIKFLVEKRVSEENANDLLELFRDARARMRDEESLEVESLLARVKPRAAMNGNANDDDGESVNDEDVIELDDDDDVPTTSRGRGRGGRGRGSRGARGRGSRGGRGKAAPKPEIEEVDEDEDSPPSSPASSTSSRGRGRGRGGRGKKEVPTPASSQNRSLRQTTLNIRRSPRKGNQAWGFDDDSD